MLHWAFQEWHQFILEWIIYSSLFEQRVLLDSFCVMKKVILASEMSLNKTKQSFDDLVCRLPFCVGLRNRQIPQTPVIFIK